MRWSKNSSMSACLPVCSPCKISPLGFPWALKLFFDLPHFMLSARRSCASSLVVLQARVWWPRGRRRRFPPAPAVRRGDGGGSSGVGGESSCCAHERESHGRAKDSVRVSAARERASEPGLPFLLSVPLGRIFRREGPRGADDGNETQAPRYLRNQVSEGTLTRFGRSVFPASPNHSDYSDNRVPSKCFVKVSDLIQARFRETFHGIAK